MAVVTGTRAEYGLLRSTLDAISDDASLELMLVVTGMHLLPKFGRTVRQIERDGYAIAARVAMQRGDDSPADQALGLARGVAGMARVFARRRPDVVLVLGDRIEALAGALAAATLGIRLAHVHGGDLAQGDFDDKLRDAITKLADLHFPASRAAAARLVRMGVPRARVLRVGAPGLDDARELLASRRGGRPGRVYPVRESLHAGWPRRLPRSGGRAARARPGRARSERAAGERRATRGERASGGGRSPGELGVQQAYRRSTAAEGSQNARVVEQAHRRSSEEVRPPCALVVQHAYGRSPEEERRVARAVLDACAACGLRRVIIAPNSDRGHRGVLRAIREHLRASPRGAAELHRSLPRDAFLRALAEADVLVGNSSAGLLEAPFLGTPAVNVGERQKGRQAGGRGVIHARESTGEILTAVRRALRMRLTPGRATVYGDGRAGRRIARRLAAD